jgi:hypothetical protein
MVAKTQVLYFIKVMLNSFKTKNYLKLLENHKYRKYLDSSALPTTKDDRSRTELTITFNVLRVVSCKSGKQMCDDES